MKKRIAITLSITIILVLITILGACYNPNADDVKYTVSYYDGDTLLQTVEVDSLDDVLEYAPEKTGMVFKKWYMDPALSVDYNMISAKADVAIALYASYEPAVFEVVFTDDDGAIIEVNGEESQSIEYGEAATAPAAPSKEGYVFVSWSVEFDEVMSDLTVRAVYQVEDENCELTFMLGDSEIYSQEVEEGVNLLAYANTAEEQLTIPSGFDFDGWYSDAEFNNAINVSTATIPQAGMTVYAKLKLLPITNVELTCDKADPVYSADSELTFVTTHSSYANIDYTYQWYYNTVGGTAISGNLDTIILNGLNAGAYTVAVNITASKVGYDSESAAQLITFSISKAELQNISADDVIATYNGNSHGFTIDGLVDGDIVSYRYGEGDFGTEEIRFTEAGEYTVSYKVERNNYNPLTLEANIKINKAPLTVKADNKSVQYGGSMPVYTYACSGFIGSDTNSEISGDALYDCLAINSLSVGEYVISVEGLSADNYEITYQTGTLTVTKRDLYVTADSKTVAYGSIAPIFTGQITGFYGSDSQSILTGEIVYTCEYEKGNNAGEYAIIPSGLSSDNYNMVYVNGELEVTKRDLTVTAENKTVNYLDNPPVYTVKYSGFIPGDDETQITGMKYCYCNYRIDNSEGGKTYQIIPGGFESVNYNVNYVSGTLTVNKIALTITVEDVSVTYGDAIPAYSVQYAGFVEGQDEESLTGTLNFNCAYNESSNVGQYIISVNGLASYNYNITYLSGNLTVTPAALTITADNKALNYGDDIPAYSATYEGFIGDDTKADLSGLETFYCDYIVGSNVGSYDIMINDNQYSSNYDISFVAGTLSVSAAALSITANDKAITYGAVAPIYTANIVGFKAGDGIEDLSGSLTFDCAYSQGAGANDYTIGFIENLSSDNYNIIYNEGTLSVGRRDITINASANFAYNGSKWQKTSWATVSGLYGTDTITGTLQSSSAAVGVYAVTGALNSSFEWVDFDIKAEGVSVVSSYNLSYVLSIEIKENTFDYTATGTEAVYDGTSYSITVTTGLSSGYILYSENGVDYSETNPEYATAGNHTVYYQIIDAEDYYDTIEGNCSVNIIKAALTVTADDNSAVYGDALPVFTSNIDGFVNGENSSVISGMLSYLCDYSQGDNVGDYSVTPYGLSADNYSMNYIAGNLAISKAALTVTADDKTVSYGDAVPTYSASYTGFVSGDTVSDLSGELDFNCQYASGSALGNYTVTPHGLISSNYTISYANGELTVQAKAITVYAEDKTTVYGQAAPTLTAASDDLVGGDQISDISGLEFFCDYSVGNDAGDYTITVSNGSNSNYTINYSTGTLEVTGKLITVTAEDKTAVYGESEVVYTITATGLVDGDTIIGLGTPQFECDYAFGSAVGVYAITPKGLTDSNYTYNYVDGELTVGALSTDVIWYGTEVSYYYNGTDQSASITPGITDIYGDTIYTTVTFSNEGSAFLTAGNYLLTAGLDNENYVLANYMKTFKMNKGEYSGITHPELTGTYAPSQTLSSITLESNYYWATPGNVPTVPVKSYSAYYNADYDNYNNFNLNITLNLAKATATVTGTTIQSANYSGSAVSLTGLGVSYSGTPISSSLYTFNYTNGNSFTAAGTYKTSVTISSDNYRVNPADFYMKVKGVLVGSTYYTIEDALNAASSGTIIVTTDTTFANADNSCYNGSAYYTIKSGVELLVPYSSSYSTTKNAVNDTATSIGSKYVKLTVPSGITLTVNGMLNVNGVRSHQSTRWMGHTGGNYGQLQLDSGAVINVNNGGKINSMGFITGIGTINALSGATIYDVLAIKDWRGGKVSNSIKDDYFVFNQYTMQNIEANLKLYCGASLYCRYYVYTSVATVNETMIVIGNDAVFELTSGYMTKFMDATTGRTHLDLYGSMTTNSTTLELNSGVPLVGSFTISTSDKEFPLSGNYSLTIKSGSNGTINNRFKVLPGAEVIVEAGATLNVTSSGKLYFFGHGVAFSNGMYTGTATPPYSGTQCKGQTRTNNISYSINDDAVFIVNGTLNMAGCLGGLIETTGITGVIHITGTLSSTMKDRLNITKVNTFGVDYTLENVSFNIKGYLNGNTTTMVALSATTYYADSSGTNTWKTTP